MRIILFRTTSLTLTWPESQDFEIVEGTFRYFPPETEGKRRADEDGETDASRAREVEKFNITIPTVGNTRRLYEGEEEENARISIYKRQDSARVLFLSPGYWLGSNVGRGWSSFLCLCARVVVSNLNYPLLLFARTPYSPLPPPPPRSRVCTPVIICARLHLRVYIDREKDMHGRRTCRPAATYKENVSSRLAREQNYRDVYGEWYRTSHLERNVGIETAMFLAYRCRKETNKSYFICGYTHTHTQIYIYKNFILY